MDIPLSSVVLYYFDTLNSQSSSKTSPVIASGLLSHLSLAPLFRVFGFRRGFKPRLGIILVLALVLFSDIEMEQVRAQRGVIFPGGRRGTRISAIRVLKFRNGGGVALWIRLLEGEEKLAGHRDGSWGQ